MTDTQASESPLDTVAETVGKRPIEAFQMLGDETRLAILLTLWDAQDPTPPYTAARDDALPFSELYDRLPIDDTGNFNYHLQHLIGVFVEESEDGYSLTQPAQRILGVVFAGSLTDPPSFEGEPIDATCYRCEAPVVVDYKDTKFIRRCTGCEGIWQDPDVATGELVSTYRPPAALENRTIQEWNRDQNNRDRHRRATMMDGVCPDCSGTVTTTIHVCADHHTPEDTVCDQCGSLWELQTQFVCDICKFAWITPAWAPIFTETGVLAFFYEHGVDPRSLFDISFYSAANRAIFEAITAVEVTGDPPRELSVTVDLDGDRIVVTLDDEAQVITVTEGSHDTD